MTGIGNTMGGLMPNITVVNLHRDEWDVYIGRA